MLVYDIEAAEAIRSSFPEMMAYLPEVSSGNRFVTPCPDWALLGRRFFKEIENTTKDGARGFCDFVEMEFHEANGSDLDEKFKRVLASVVSEVGQYTSAAVRAMLWLFVRDGIFIYNDEREGFLKKLLDNGYAGTVLVSGSARPSDIVTLSRTEKIRFKTGHMGAQNEAKRFFEFLSKDIVEHPENIDIHAELIRAVEIWEREKTPELVAAMEEYAYASLAAVQPGDDNGPVL